MLRWKQRSRSVLAHGPCRSPGPNGSINLEPSGTVPCSVGARSGGDASTQLHPDRTVGRGQSWGGTTSRILGRLGHPSPAQSSNWTGGGARPRLEKDIQIQPSLVVARQGLNIFFRGVAVMI